LNINRVALNYRHLHLLDFLELCLLALCMSLAIFIDTKGIHKNTGLLIFLLRITMVDWNLFHRTPPESVHKFPTLGVPSKPRPMGVD